MLQELAGLICGLRATRRKSQNQGLCRQTPWHEERQVPDLTAAKVALSRSAPRAIQRSAEIGVQLEASAAARYTLTETLTSCRAPQVKPEGTQPGFGVAAVCGACELHGTCTEKLAARCWKPVWMGHKEGFLGVHQHRAAQDSFMSTRTERQAWETLLEDHGLVAMVDCTNRQACSCFWATPGWAIAVEHNSVDRLR